VLFEESSAKRKLKERYWRLSKGQMWEEKLSGVTGIYNNTSYKEDVNRITATNLFVEVPVQFT